MKNKLKKSKIIVPALALITATTAASVTGTVAWFSANRAATVTASFQATDSEGNLLLKSTKGVGTTVASSTFATTSAVTVDGKLTHGSYNAADSGATTGELYVADISEPTEENTNYSVVGYTSHGAISGNTGDNITPTTYPWMAGKTADTTPVKIWYAVSWTVSIKLESIGNASATNMVFVDFNKTTFGNDTDVNAGFRVALMDGTHTYIIGNDDVTSHVTGAATTEAKAKNAVGDWDPYHQFGETYTKVKDNVSKTTAETVTNGFLFELADTDPKDITVVAWYEGEDPAVTSGENSFTASDLSLNFYCRSTIND